MTQSYSQMLLEARKFQQTGRYDEALELCNKLLAENPDDPGIRVLTALTLTQKSNLQEAKGLLPELNIVTDDNRVASDLGLLAILRGDSDTASKYLEQAVSSDDADYVALARLGSLQIMQAHYSQAEFYLRSALERSPEHPAILSNLGGVLLRQEKFVDALDAYESALRLAPDLVTAQQGRMAILVMQDRSNEILDEISEQLGDQPESVELREKKYNILLIEERLEEARDVLRELILLRPHEISYPLNLLNLFAREEQYPLVLKELAKFELDFPDQPDLLIQKARAYRETMRLQLAQETIEKALAISPESPHILINRALVYADQEEYELAESDLRQALDTHPGLADGWSLLGYILLWRGKLDEAVEALKRASSINPSALTALAEARSIPDDPDVLNCMQRFASLKLIPSESRAAMNFALSRLFEDKGDYIQAYKAAEKANQLTRAGIKHDTEKHHVYTRNIIETFTPELFKKFEGIGNYNERPVFVIGMPRSGTTLTEQILASHPKVFGAGELGVINAITRLMPIVLKIRNRYPFCMENATPHTIDHAARYYLKALRKRDSDAKRVVDKLPHNFMHLGLISILFPYAKIIHVKRDLRDIAISNYFTNFKMKRSGLSYAFDMAEIGHMLNDYTRIMEHWHNVLPVKIYEYNYEDLVSDPEKYEKQLIEYIELDWTPDVMDFYHSDRAVRTASVWQVRQPIYNSSKERWKHYQEFLDPLVKVLDQS